ncbi:cytoplasmic tRNA 2-thiolation protein 2-like [Hoplias malabaricus]|uniref:cytoplasmic tRNA 2-thiolation protein 2-like n=1 Tax=Hoplias malabaricus TaxID=27720 RepID=UPI003463663B
MCQVEEEYNEHLETKPVLRVSRTCVKCKENTAVLIIRVGDAFCRTLRRGQAVEAKKPRPPSPQPLLPAPPGVYRGVPRPVETCSLSSVLLVCPRASSLLDIDPSHRLQLLRGYTEAFPGQSRHVVSPACSWSAPGPPPRWTCPEHLTREASRRLPDQTPEPPQLAPLDVEEQRLHSESLPDVFSLPDSVLEPVYGGPEGSDLSYKAAVDQYIQQNKVKQRAQDSAIREAHEAIDRLSVQSQCSPDHRLALERLFSSLKTLTAKEDMLQTLRQHVILHTARMKGYAKVMMGDSCTRLAVKLLSNISLGRGAALAADTGFSDPRYGDVVIVRPMRDYSSKEIAFYNMLFGVQSIFIPGLDTKVPDKASIQRLTESFVIKLQADFPSTVSTIYRTSEKLHTSCPQLNTTEPAAKCLLCLCALDTKADEASAFNATQLSERLSERKAQRDSSSSNLTVNSSSSCGREGGCASDGCCSTLRAAVSTDLKSLLCYSCRLTIKDMTEVDTLPRYITSEAEKRQRRAQMKQEISEFLLQDEDEAEEE